MWPCLSSEDSWESSSACAPFARRCWSLVFCLLRLKPENVARLARERLANRIERREADRARLAGLEDREVGQRHSDPVREFGQRHTPIVEEVVELDGDSHVTPFLRGLRACVCLLRTRGPAGT